MPEMVETYSGARLHEEPRRFHWEGEWQVVQTVQARWRTPEGLFFLVVAEDGSLFELFCHREEGAWRVLPRRQK